MISSLKWQNNLNRDNNSNIFVITKPKVINCLFRDGLKKMKKNLLFLSLLILSSTLSYGIEIITSSGNYKGRDQTPEGLRIN